MLEELKEKNQATFSQLLFEKYPDKIIEHKEELSDAVTKKHTQNTDTGTTQTSFAIDSGGTGVRIKDSSGEAQVRNLADSALLSAALGLGARTPMNAPQRCSR